MQPLRTILASILIVVIAAAGMAYSQSEPAAPSPSATPPAPASAILPAEQLDTLVAPIALYPDPLLSQTLVASTYPLEVIQLHQWLQKHKDLKDAALADAVQKEDWDPSIQAMAALGDVVKLLAENIQWTTELGNAFLAQQSDVMDAVQRMRKKAKDSGKLKSNEQQTVDTQVVENKTVVVIEQANPQVVYVPSYDPVMVYGPPIYPYYPYPPIVYPPYYGAIAFGVGIAIGVAVGGGWGYGCGWGSNNVNINVNNNYINNSNRVNGGGNRPAGGNNNWQHNPQHRGAAPYSDRATASKYGGAARGDSVATRPADTGGAGGRQPGTADRGAGSMVRRAIAEAAAIAWEIAPFRLPERKRSERLRGRRREQLLGARQQPARFFEYGWWPSRRRGRRAPPLVNYEDKAHTVGEMAGGSRRASVGAVDGRYGARLCRR